MLKIEMHMKNLTTFLDEFNEREWTFCENFFYLQTLSHQEKVIEPQMRETLEEQFKQRIKELNLLLKNKRLKDLCRSKYRAELKEYRRTRKVLREGMYSGQ